METVMGPDSIREQRLTALMERYEKELLRMCCVYLRDVALAEDAVQETFIKAYRALDSFRGGDETEKSWLCRIAINVCKDMRRSAWLRFIDRRISLEMLPEPVAPVPPVLKEITECVMRLPRKELEATLLYHFQGLTQAEVGRTLGITPAAVSIRLRKARTRLKTMLEEGGLTDAPQPTGYPIHHP